MNPVVDLLTRAKARTLAHPCVNANARNRYGNAVVADSPLAVCWDALGAIYREQNNEEHKLTACSLLSRAAVRLSVYGAGPLKYPSVINDCRPDLIPQMFDLAIEEASR